MQQQIGTILYGIALPKEAKASNAVVAVECILCGKLCQCKWTIRFVFAFEVILCKLKKNNLN
jgi:hypothetical protein